MGNHLAVVDLMSENGRLTRENEALRKALEHIEDEAGRYAQMYPIGSDGRNTFTIFAAAVGTKRAALALKEPGQ